MSTRDVPSAGSTPTLTIAVTVSSAVSASTRASIDT
jgi:hypothetical protein